MIQKDKREQYLIFTQNLKKISSFYICFISISIFNCTEKPHNSQDTEKNTQKEIISSGVNVALVSPEESLKQVPTGSK